MKRRRGLKVDKVVTVTLAHDGVQTQLPARVVWVRRDSYFSYEFGFEFGELSAEQRSVLSILAQRGATQETIYRPSNAA